MFDDFEMNSIEISSVTKSLLNYVQFHLFVENYEHVSVL